MFLVIDVCVGVVVLFVVVSVFCFVWCSYMAWFVIVFGLVCFGLCMVLFCFCILFLCLMWFDV